MNRVKPTSLQKKTLEIKRDNPDMPLKQAMIKAGYSPKTSRTPRQNFLDLKGVAVAIEQWREQLRGTGLGEQKLLEKYKEWVDAVKIKSSMTEPDRVEPDYETQLKVKDDLRRDLGLPTEKESCGVLQQYNIGGEMKLEFILDDELEPENKKTEGV